MLGHELSVEQVSIDTLKPAEYNPRKWSDKQIADLKESVKRFGLHLRDAVCKRLHKWQPQLTLLL